MPEPLPLPLPRLPRKLQLGLNHRPGPNPRALQVPVQCLIQRTKLSLSTHTIDYDTAGGVLLAESLTESFTIVNDGALEAHYVILVDETAATATLPPGLRSDLAAETLAVAGAAEEGVGADGSGADAAAGGGDLAPIRSLSTRRVDNAQSTSLETQGFSIAAARGTVPGYGRVVIPITFAPKVSGLVRLPLKILYIAPKVPTLLIEPHELLLSATGREMPVYTDTELLDFKCCMFDHVYKSSLMLHNSGKTTMKVGGRLIAAPGVCHLIGYDGQTVVCPLLALMQEVP